MHLCIYLAMPATCDAYLNSMEFLWSQQFDMIARDQNVGWELGLCSHGVVERSRAGKERAIKVQW